MRFETEKDLTREKKAVQKFVDMFGGSFKKLDPNDVDYEIYDNKNKLIAYAEVKGRYRSILNAFPLPVACRKVVKLCDKRLNPVLIWACDDGIIYGKPNEIKGEVKWGGRKPRQGSCNDQELMLYYPKQNGTKCIKY